jgi:hypothetical protein
MGEFDLKTEFVTPESGSLVLCWDTLFLKSQNMKDRLPCHGKIGVVVKKTTQMIWIWQEIPWEQEQTDAGMLSLMKKRKFLSSTSNG